MKASIKMENYICTHVHREIRAQNSPNVVCETPFVEGVRGYGFLLVNYSPLISNEVSEMPPHEEEERSDETLYRMNPEVFRGGNNVVDCSGVDEGVSSKG
ncbi:hypothetical protein PIB30_075665 [Stylosanthes scabra]|uniref:Uncharacterized protein n=1 Tax=Stylosanthes scabra TaxID=79078 RepID=A0ABU6USD7_9FABA|nr:hypothetical protein [Stylosanthes scabra]